MTILKAYYLTMSRLHGSPFSNSRSIFLPKLNFTQGWTAEPSRACVCTCACMYERKRIFLKVKP